MDVLLQQMSSGNTDSPSLNIWEMALGSQYKGNCLDKK